MFYNGPMVRDELNASDIECAHCGEQFYYELTRCPSCGVNVYYPEIDDDLDQGISVRNPNPVIAKVGDMLQTVAYGFTITSGITFLFFLIIKRGFSLQAGSNAETFAILGIIILGSALAGFVAARTAQHHPRILGILMGLTSIGVSVVLFAYSRDLAVFPLITQTVLIGWALVILAGYLGARLAISRTRQVAIQRLFEGQPSEEEHYQDLLTKARFDEALADRLIAYERELAPNASRYYLIKRAIERWERDNR